MRLVAAAAVVALAQAPPAREVVRASSIERLDAYLAAYEPKLSALVADEVFLQETPPLTSAMLRPLVIRRIESEVAFARLPGEVSWLGFRRVNKVNGTVVGESAPALAKLLSLGPEDRLAQAQLMVMQSSEHNLGSARTINMPNLPLELLQPRYRARFAIALGAPDRIRGRSAMALAFAETAEPSIVSYGERRDLLARMHVWVDSTSGAILRARVRLAAKDGADDPQIDVEFEDHKTLGMLVPVRMDERFPIARSAPGKGRATYTNFRRFQTSARIVPQP